MRTTSISEVVVALGLAFPMTASAQSGHLVGQQDCDGDDLSLTCEGKARSLRRRLPERQLDPHRDRRRGQAPATVDL